MQNISLKVYFLKNKEALTKVRHIFQKINYFKDDVFQTLIKVVSLIFTRELIINHIFVLFSAYKKRNN